MCLCNKNYNNDLDNIIKFINTVQKIADTHANYFISIFHLKRMKSEIDIIINDFKLINPTIFNYIICVIEKGALLISINNNLIKENYTLHQYIEKLLAVAYKSQCVLAKL